jgi:hypothetical protein
MPRPGSGSGTAANYLGRCSSGCLALVSGLAHASGEAPHDVLDTIRRLNTVPTLPRAKPGALNGQAVHNTAVDAGRAPVCSSPSLRSARAFQTSQPPWSGRLESVRRRAPRGIRRPARARARRAAKPRREVPLDLPSSWPAAGAQEPQQAVRDVATLPRRARIGKRGSRRARASRWSSRSAPSAPAPPGTRRRPRRPRTRDSPPRAESPLAAVALEAVDAVLDPASTSRRTRSFVAACAAGSRAARVRAAVRAVASSASGATTSSKNPACWGYGNARTLLVFCGGVAILLVGRPAAPRPRADRQHAAAEPLPGLGAADLDLVRRGRDLDGQLPRAADARDANRGGARLRPGPGLDADRAGLRARGLLVTSAGCSSASPHARSAT